MLPGPRILIQAAIEGGRFVCEEALRDRPVCGQAKKALAGASALARLQFTDIEHSLRSSLEVQQVKSSMIEEQ